MVDEKDLLLSTQQGDEQAFERLIEMSLAKLRALLIKQYKLQPTDLDDIIQNATLKVFKKIDTFRNESAFTTWFYIILRHEAIDFIKKRNLIQQHEVVAHFVDEDGDNEQDYTHLSVEQTLEETASSLMERRELLEAYRDMIRQVFEQLSPTHSQIIKLSIEESKSYQEIAKELGIPIGTVMSRLFFARKNAQRLIQQYARHNAIQLNGLGRRNESPIHTGN
jgi:RNA polymerase sigma-70 factor (ECF subfamily)